MSDSGSTQTVVVKNLNSAIVSKRWMFTTFCNNNNEVDKGLEKIYDQGLLLYGMLSNEIITAGTKHRHGVLYFVSSTSSREIKANLGPMHLEVCRRSLENSIVYVVGKGGVCHEYGKADDTKGHVNT